MEDEGLIETHMGILKAEILGIKSSRHSAIKLGLLNVGMQIESKSLASGPTIGAGRVYLFILIMLEAMWPSAVKLSDEKPEHRLIRREQLANQVM